MKRIISSFMTLALILGAILVPASTAPAWNGDANGDGQIDLTDVTLILKYIAKWDVEIDPLADFDVDGSVNLGDVTKVLQYIAKWNVSPDSLLEAEYGVTAVDFTVPEPTPTETVKGSDFGFSTESANNYNAWIAAIAYLKEHPGTTLEIEKGVYKMANASTIAITGLNNCVIDGGGSTFLFSTGAFFGVSNSDLLKIKNFTVDWDYEVAGYPTTSVVRVRDRYATDDPKIDKIEYEFILVDDASYAVTQPWDSMIFMDPETLTVGTPGGEGDMFYVKNWHLGFETDPDEPNVITATVKSDCDPKVGDLWLVRHYNYRPGCFVQSSGTNITYEDLTIYSGPGGGIYLQNQGTHHVRIDGITIGLNPENSDKIRMSVTADALNFKNTGGYIIVENSDVGYQGDDCMNIHTTPGMVEYAYDNILEMIVRNGNNFYVGCKVGFKKASDFTEHEFTATITGYKHVSTEEFGQHYIATLDKDVPYDIEEDWIVYNMDNNGENYIVRNNYFHENRARGLLLGSPNGLVENNRFYRHQLSAINISLDHGSQWIEGTGVNNIILRNNIFEECNIQGSNGNYISIFANSDFGTGGMILGECFKNILISGNTFINTKDPIITARCVTGLAVVNNTIKNPDPIIDISDPENPFLHRGEIELRGFEIRNATVIHNTWEASPYISENVNVVDTNDQIRKNQLTEYGNYIKPAKE